MIATPYSMCLRGDDTRVRELFLQLQTEIRKRMPDMQLVLSCEVLCSKEYLPDVLTNLKTGRFPTLGNTESVLIEFPTNTEVEEISTCADAIIDAGWKSVIAHIERLFEPPDIVRCMHTRSVLFQVNAYSLADEQKKIIKIMRTVFKGKN